MVVSMLADWLPLLQLNFSYHGARPSEWLPDSVWKSLWLLLRKIQVDGWL